MFSMWPPSDRLSHARFSDMAIPVISRIKQVNPGTCGKRLCPGRRIQKPSRTFKKVRSAARVGMDSKPICEEAAAPDTAIAVARSGLTAFIFQVLVWAKPTTGEPHQCLENKKKSALRSRSEEL